MFLPVKKDITIFKGIQFRMVFRASTKNCAARDNTKVPVDLTNYNAYMQIRKKTCGCDKELLFDLNSPVSYISVTDPVNGEITINIPPSVTGDLAFTCGEYWIVMHSKNADENFLLMYGEVSTTCPVTIVPDFVPPEPEPEPEVLDVLLLSTFDDRMNDRGVYLQSDQTKIGSVCDQSLYVGNGAIVGRAVSVDSNGGGPFSISLINGDVAVPSMIIDPIEKYSYVNGRYVQPIQDDPNPGFWSLILVDERLHTVDCRHMIVAIVDGTFQIVFTHDFTIGDESVTDVYLYFAGYVDVSTDGQCAAIMFEVEDVATGDGGVAAYVVDLITYRQFEMPLQVFSSGDYPRYPEIFWLSKKSTDDEHILVTWAVDYENPDSRVFTAYGFKDVGDPQLRVTQYYKSGRYVGPFRDMVGVRWQDGENNKVAVIITNNSLTTNVLFVRDFENVVFDFANSLISEEPPSIVREVTIDINTEVVPSWSVDKTKIIAADINKGVWDVSLNGDAVLYDQFPRVEPDYICGIQAIQITNLLPVTCAVSGPVDV